MKDQAEIIVDGRMLYRGHRLAWRRGVVTPIDGATVAGLCEVVLERRGRERKNPRATLFAGWLLVRTEDILAKLQQHGLLDGRDDARLSDER